jgi:hypothetical protein
MSYFYKSITRVNRESLASKLTNQSSSIFISFSCHSDLDRNRKIKGIIFVSNFILWLGVKFHAREIVRFDNISSFEWQFDSRVRIRNILWPRSYATEMFIRRHYTMLFLRIVFDIQIDCISRLDNVS